MNTRKQKVRERFAKMCDDIACGNSEEGRKLRALNRRVDKRKREQFQKETKA